MNQRHSETAPLVLITGGGSGVGLALARAFAARGAQLILCGNDGPALARAGRELGAATRFCDVSLESSVAILEQDLATQFPQIDILINAAGDGYVRTLGMMRITLAILPSMRRKRTPKLIFNVAPDFGTPQPGESLFPNVSSPRNFRRLSASLSIQARGSAVRVATITPRRAMSGAVGGAIGTKCDEPDVVAAIISAVFGGPAVDHEAASAVSCRPTRTGRAG